jgi:hypothetical protein
VVEKIRQGRAAQAAFSVTLSATAQTVLLTVRDDSPALPTRRAAQAMDQSGRGLEIVGVVSHDWGTNEVGVGAKGVWASFAIRALGSSRRSGPIRLSRVGSDALRAVRRRRRSG